MDTTIWRELGDPLVAGAIDGPLAGSTVAVKDLYDVAGHPVGAGNRARLATAVPAPDHARVVADLLAAGTSVQGITQTDEFAYSLFGVNEHYGAPPNPAAPGRVPGGSSSGSAAAVALGEVTVGLGSDTGGSIRVPAAYQGLYGIRTTHGLVSRDGLLPLAPTFDAVGWLTRDPEELARVGEVLLPASPGGGDDLVVVPELIHLADRDVSTAVTSWLPGTAADEEWDLTDLPAWREAFIVLQAWEAWQAHGAWLEVRLDTLGADVRGRFERASGVTTAEADDARATVDGARRTIRDLVGDRVLILPSAPTVAPRFGDDLTVQMQAIRATTLALTCIAGIGGLPAVSIPLTTVEGLPCGVCLVAAPGRDRDLLDLAQQLDGELGSP
ncbi:amidase [Nocardioides pelophilus]|uniref:amidase n=1 Tax=Nocardioides pelophilus TaxID=2172019 RepID=UPI0016032E2B|nr:amidase [Nocardioides pelophilus]